MATQLFLRTTASDLGGAGQWALAATRGAASATLVTNTVASGDNLTVTQTAGGQALSWFSAPLQAVTVTGAVTVNIRGLESATAANAAAGIRIERCDSTGAVLSVIVPNTAVPAASNEYTTADTARTASITPTSTSLAQGDRIKVTVLVKAASGVVMGGARTVTNSVNGPTAGAAGDSYVTFVETLIAFSGAAPATLAATAAVGGAVAKAGATISAQVLACATAIPTPARPTALFVKTVGTGQKSASALTTVLTLGAGVNVALGNRLVIAWGGSINSIGTGLICDDSKGNTYSPYLKAGNDTADAVAAFFCAPITTALVPGDTITVTQGGTSTSGGWMAAYEWSGLTVPGFAEGAFGTSTTPASGPVDPGAGAVYVGLLTTHNTSGFVTGSLGSPWTARHNVTPTSGSAFRAYGTWDRMLPTGSGGIDFQPTLGSSTLWAAGVLAMTQGTEPATPAVIYSWVGAVTTSQAVVVACTAHTSSVRIATSTDPTMINAVYTAATTPDANGYVKHTVTGLTAGTYYYGVELDGIIQAARGTFTIPPAGPHSFVIAAGSCAVITAATSPTRALARNPVLGLLSGDTPYVDITSNSPDAIRGTHESWLSRPEWHSFLRKVPTAYVWSDHDFGSNNADGTVASEPAAQTVYRQQTPHYPLPSGSDIYQTFTRGRVRFILTDNRSNKSPQANTDNSSKTILGATQKQWWKDTITAATETLIVWVNENPWIGAAVAGEDEWSGYTTERAELGAFAIASGKNIVMLSGDMHALAYDNGANSVGRIPVFHAAPWINAFSNKGGPYTLGPYPTSGTGNMQQYGMITITDDGGGLSVRFAGYDTSDVLRIDATLSWVTPQPVAAVASFGSVGLPTHVTRAVGTLACVADLPTADAVGEEVSATPDTIAARAGMGADVEPPSVPTGLHQAGATSTTVDLAWNPSTDNWAVAFYEVVVQGGP